MGEIQDLHGLPCLTGRVAVAADVEAGNAVFVLEPQGNPYEMNLPRRARFRNEDGSYEEVILIQAESHPNHSDVIVGYRQGDGRIGAAFLYEMELL